MDRKLAGIGIALAAYAANPSLHATQRGETTKDATGSGSGTASAPASGTDLFIRPESARARDGRALLDGYFRQTRTTRRPVARRPSIDVVIATVPDPLDSHLDYEFDAELAAIRQAFELSGYLIDRFWLPWPLDREKSELAARSSRIDTTLYRRTYPGVILFRSIDGRRLRLLYLVGEVPTSGIHQGAFARALAERDSLRWDPRVSHGTRTLRIVGPAFTGGAAGLADALAAQAGAPGARRDSIDIISGAATGATARDFEGRSLRFAYHATVNSDTAFKLVIRNVLCGTMRIPATQIALLRESSTLYGAGLPPSPERGTAPTVGASCGYPFLDIPFPANISSLRSEYARTPLQGQPELALPGQGGSRIPLDLQDPARAMENPPVMSGLTPAMLDAMLDEIAVTLSTHRIRAVGVIATDARDKLFLAQQLRRRLRDVTLFTTESNLLLLRPEVSTTLRGTLVFATYPLHVDAQRWDTAGVNRRRLVFASDGSEGIFNATRLQLSDTASLAEYGLPGLADAPLYCGRGPSSGSARAPLDSIPPIWVLAVGRGAFSPISACPTGNESGLLRARPAGAALRSAPAHRVPAATIPFLSVMLLTLVLAYLGLERRQLDELRRGAAVASVDRCMRRTDRPLLVLHGHLYALLRVFALTVLVAGAGVGVVHVMDNEAHTTSSLLFVALAGAMTGLAMVVVRAAEALHGARMLAPALYQDVPEVRRQGIARLLRAPARLRAPADAARIPAFVRAVWTSHFAPEWSADERDGLAARSLDVIGRVLVAALAVTFLVWVGGLLRDIQALRGSSPLRQELFLHRAGELGGGLSPAMFLALTGAMFALWCTWHLDRIRMLLAPPSAFESASHHSLGVPPHGADLRGPARWSQSMRDVRQQLLVFLPDAESAALFAVFAVLALLLVRVIVPSYETLLFPEYGTRWPILRKVARDGTFFDFLARFGITAALAATGWSLYRARRIWRALRHTLDELGRMPRVTMFERLPRRVARLTRLNVLRTHADELVNGISMTQWSHLRQLYLGMAVEKRRLLTQGLGDVELPGGEVVSAERCLQRLMDCSESCVCVWPQDDWMSGRAPYRNREEEAAAIRFLLAVTEQAHRLEPAKDDVGVVLERTREGGAAGSDATRSTSGHIRRTFGDSTRLWIRSAEELIAVQAVHYIQWGLHHLRHLTVYVVVSLVIVTQLMASYTLRPVNVLWVMVILLVVAAVVLLVSLVIEMNRNEVLSRISGTTPGTVTWDWHFVLNLALIAVVPTITLVGSELPWLGDALFSWLDPLLKTLSRH